MKTPFCLNLFALLCAFLTVTISAGTVIDARRDDSACERRTHVVIDSSTVEIYNATIHGTDARLRLFEMIPLACPDRHTTRALPREPWSRTDIQLRDTRTELSTIVFRRGFFTWVKSQLKWVPWVSTAFGFAKLAQCTWKFASSGSIDDKFGCILGGVALAVGPAYQVMRQIGVALPTAGDHANEVIEMINAIWDEVGISNDMSRRANNPNVSATIAKYQSWTIPGVRHHISGNNVSLWDVARANSTHPITIVHSTNPVFQANHSHVVHLWSSVPSPGSGIPRLHSLVPFPYDSDTTSATTSVAPSELGRRQGSAGSSGSSSGSSGSSSSSSGSSGSGVACTGASIDLGQATDCVTGTGNPIPSGAPTAMYYGFDLYGTKAQIQEFQDDLGTTFDDENGFVPAIEAMAGDIADTNAWDTCGQPETKDSFFARETWREATPWGCAYYGNWITIERDHGHFKAYIRELRAARGIRSPLRCRWNTDINGDHDVPRHGPVTAQITRAQEDAHVKHQPLPNVVTGSTHAVVLKVVLARYTRSITCIATNSHARGTEIAPRGMARFLVRSTMEVRPGEDLNYRSVADLPAILYQSTAGQSAKNGIRGRDLGLLTVGGAKTPSRRVMEFKGIERVAVKGGRWTDDGLV
ncbi:hypothetical protein GGX14DRAFT_397108 [Mycena pura]|uniref:Uncharacterized protein n=1 Tax=Mycena pura TaxID=153505 RepID=A0AAD6V9V5_9AGAR|nr:hypothetical protein GGX14DRAFT_397108 [Mycena pura]